MDEGKKMTAMTTRDAVMFAAYLVIIATGVIVSGSMYWFGIGQILFGAVMFGLRLWVIFVLKPRRAALAKATP